MCWCTPNIRTPCCGKPECHPRDKAEHNAANTEIDALRARIAELERQVQEAHAELGLASQTDVQARLHARVSELEEIARLAAASVRNQAWAGICDEDILLEQALVKANFI